MLCEADQDLLSFHQHHTCPRLISNPPAMPQSMSLGPPPRQVLSTCGVQRMAERDRCAWRSHHRLSPPSSITHPSSLITHHSFTTRTISHSPPRTTRPSSSSTSSGRRLDPQFLAVSPGTRDCVPSAARPRHHVCPVCNGLGRTRAKKQRHGASVPSTGPGAATEVDGYTGESILDVQERLRMSPCGECNGSGLTTIFAKSQESEVRFSPLFSWFRCLYWIYQSSPPLLVHSSRRA